MNLLRGLLFDNLGLKLAALLLALLVYLNVYLDRPAEMTLSFPVQITGLGDSLALSGPVPSTVQAQVRGTGKQLLRLRVTEPPVKISLDGVGPSRFERAVSVEDLPLAMLSRVLAWKVVVTAGFFMTAKTGHLRSWLAPNNRSIVTSLKPRAGTLAMRSRLMSSCGLMKTLR